MSGPVFPAVQPSIRRMAAVRGIFLDFSTRNFPARECIGVYDMASDIAVPRNHRDRWLAGRFSGVLMTAISPAQGDSWPISER